MKTVRMSLENIQGKMARTEMRNIMAGSGCFQCTCSGYSESTFMACSISECWSKCL